MQNTSQMLVCAKAILGTYTYASITFPPVEKNDKKITDHGSFYSWEILTWSITFKLLNSHQSTTSTEYVGNNAYVLPRILNNPDFLYSKGG